MGEIKTTKGLRSFLGITSYYHEFVWDFVKIAKPLSNLLKEVGVRNMGRALLSRIW